MEETQTGLQQELGIPDEAFDEARESNHPERRSRAAKKRDKIQKRLKRFQDPEFKKAERQKKRKREKLKLQTQTKGMDREQKGQFVAAKKLQKAKIKQKMFEAMKIGLPILVDLVYEQHMNSKQRKSLAVQIQLIYKSMRKLQHPCSLHLCSLGSSIEQALTGMRYKFWPITSHKQDVGEVGKMLGKQLIYLSPDAPEALEEVRADHVYIIGGLVDRTVLKNASLKRAEYLGIKARKLPIDQWMQNRKCLNLDHVALMLCKWLEVRDWVQAFEYAAPQRWKKEDWKEGEAGKEGDKQGGNNQEGGEGSSSGGSSSQSGSISDEEQKYEQKNQENKQLVNEPQVHKQVPKETIETKPQPKLEQQEPPK